MFRRLSEPLPLSEASVLAMRPALNAPVLNVGFLPVGPARAAIVAFGEEWGGIGLALGIRSNEGGQVAVFRNQESIEPDVSIAAALEPALAEAERMGFLFDEDMVEATADGRNRALALWGRLMGELELPEPPRAVPSQPATSESIRPLPDRVALAPTAPTAPAASPEVLLDDIVEIEPAEISLELEAPISRRAPVRATQQTPPVARSASQVRAPDVSQETQPMVAARRRPPTEVVPPQPVLAKFRRADAAVAPADRDPGDTKGGNPLGRIPLVRVRKERDGTKRTPYLARLLSSF